MEQVISIILAIIGSSTITSLVLLKGKKRASDTQSYQLLIDDLNERFKEALERMRTLEGELNKVIDDNRALRQENDELRAENARLKLAAQ